ncbi:MAG: AAA family ATPase [Acidobacteria bacterium]|nr:AAA family ATPase [Acidobacteriota bacterium]
MSQSNRVGEPADGGEQQRLATGSAGLDLVLHGGFPANRLYLVEGDPGTGKTTLALQFLLEGARLGEPVLYVTLSETKEELTDVARSHGWSLEGVNLHELVPPEESLKAEAQYTIFHPSEVELGETTRAVIDEVERIQPRRVVFDSLSEMRLLARDPLRYRRQILALKQFFAGRRSTVLLLDDRTSADADLQVQSIAHGVLMLEQMALDYGAERRRLRVSKLRGSRYRGGFHDFTIKTGGVEVYPRLVASGHRQEFEHDSVTSGVAELDALLGGGLDRGTATLIMGPAGSGNFLTAQMHELLSYLNQQGVVTILVMAQHGFVGSGMDSPVDVSYLADTVVMLRYFEAAGAIRRAISVIKKRTGPHEDTIRELRLSASRGVEVGAPLTNFRGVLTGVPVFVGDAAKNAPLLGEDDDER